MNDPDLVQDVFDLDSFAETVDREQHDPSDRPSLSLAETVKEIRFHAEHRYWHFTPSYGSEFEPRLLAWINNPGLTLADKESLLRLLPELAFVDRDDMMSLYKTAFAGHVHRWIMDQKGLDFRLSESKLRTEIDAAIKKTWICPLTDSLDIGQFHHVNKLSTHSHRPQWRTLQHFGSVRKIRDYVRSQGIERLVLVEDIVGSGSQCSRVLQAVVDDLVPDLPVLFVPLMVSEVGLEVAEATMAQGKGCKVEPVVVVPKIVHVQAVPSVNEPEFVVRARSIVERTKTQFRGGRFGYGRVGSLVVLYTNCPNTTPPMIWLERPDWAPIFPRVPRPRA